MTTISRRKKVTDPFDDKMKARIFGSDHLHDPVYFSEHSSQNDDESPCLSNLLCGFHDELDAVAGEDRSLPENDSDSEPNYDHRADIDNLEVLNQALLNENADQFRNTLLGQVLKATEIFWFVKSNGSLLMRNVMAFLRSAGYNAGICKTKWETSGGLTAGNHEFIDVLRSVDRKTYRYFIDLNFIGEFEIARQTNHYDALLRTLPSVFIGKCENLKQIVKVMSEEARRSLKSGGLHLPPWRKNRFMQIKWFGLYRRIVNLIPANSCSDQVKQNVTVKCRSVGFDAVGRQPIISATTRTRYLGLY